MFTLHCERKIMEKEIKQLKNEAMHYQAENKRLENDVKS